ncbi:hypothetical protein [Nocardia cyriacigeorgica]|uniref:hypothetical protein n=1 Tax=Nocardia cyriacigeorgica TaxID=135487 RepID=UPI001895D3B6|nr:hypothetical protein [Nocardia cyriacigeorgica]MBF6452644.1 hypothetical protein [Nocardia cyriacigeorgica]MBF6477938.1 hypothetical protein [Nocardia cyriacigeorgica]MBF6549813.1 hypothetical protein [Nocardia cyriacigeorgica]
MTEFVSAGSELVSYFARRNASGRTGILRQLPGGRTESFGPAGTWEAVKIPDPAEDPEATPVTAENAALEIYRQRESGAVPRVEGVAIPLLPRSMEPAPRPGAGPVDIYQAQAIADEWMGRATSGKPGRGGVYEFDEGFVVYPLVPAIEETPTSESTPRRPRPRRAGGGVGVIDRRTGRLSLWPNLPHMEVADIYRRSRAQR